MKGESLNTQCSCTSQKIIEEMTIEDVNGMAEATANGEFQRGRILLQAYAPCMQYPARSILLEKCTNDPNMKKTVAAYEQACSCMADRMAQYVALNGPMIIAKSLRSTAPNPNPLSDLMRDPDFQSQAQRELAECVKTPTAPLHPPDQIPLAPSIDEPPPPVNKGIEVQGQ